MKSVMAYVARAVSRRLISRLRVVAPTALLVSGLLTVWAGHLATPAAASGGGDWTSFRNGPTHTGYNTAETTISAANVDALGVAWTGATGGPIYSSSPAVADGVAYIGSSDGNLYAYAVGCATHGGSCTPIWTGNTGSAIWSSPTVSGGVVYVGTGGHKMYAFAVGCATGGAACTPLWTASSGGSIYTDSSSPTVSGGVVYIGATDGKLYAYAVGCRSDGGSCTPIWTGATGGIYIALSSPAVSGGVVYVGSQNGKLYAFAVGCASGGGTCAPLWTAQASTNGGVDESTPTVSDGVVYIGSADHSLYAFDAAGVTGCGGSPKTCTPLWTGVTGNMIFSGPAVANGVVYVSSLDGKLYAYAVGCASGGGTCTPLWKATTGGIAYSSPAVANGVVYVGSTDHKIYAYAEGCNSGGGSCAPLWTATTGGPILNGPAIANGVVYVGSEDDSLYAFGLDHGALDHLAVSPATATVTAGVSQSYTAEGFDAYGHSWDVTSLTTFSVGGGGSCTGTSCTAMTPGDHTVTGTDGTATGTATLHVPAPWPQFRNDPSHQGNNTAETILSPANVHDLGVVWTGTTSAETMGTSPVVADGVVYVGGEDGKMYAFAVGCSTGGAPCTPLWTATTGDWIQSAAAVADGVVYVDSHDGYLYAYAVGCRSDGGTCAPLWSTWTANYGTSPTVADGVVYVGTRHGSMLAFATDCYLSGPCSPLWVSDIGVDLMVFSPAVAGGVVYAGSDDGNLYAYPVGCRSDGGICSPIWVGRTGDAIEGSPSVANSVVYVGSTDHKLYAFAVGCASGGATCAPIWTSAAAGAQLRSSPAVANGVVYVGSDDDNVYAYAVGCASGGGTCSPLWVGPTGGSVSSSPAVANGVVYVGSSDNKLYAFAVGCASDGGTCSPLWTYATGDWIDASPAIANGVVYVGSADGKLYAFGLDHGATDHLVLTPSSATITAGDSQAYIAFGSDAYGNSLGNVTASTTFTIDRGGLCTGTSCTTTIAGDHTVTGSVGSAHGTATLHVVLPNITGTVTGPGGAPLAKIEVSVTSQGSPDRHATTAVDGTYAISDVVSGSYMVTFNDPNGHYAFGYYSGSGYVRERQGAALVAIADGSATVVDVELPLGHSISGTVTGPDNEPVVGLQMDACLTTWYGDCGEVTTAADGTYTINDLGPSTYFVFADSSGAYGRGFYLSSAPSGFTSNFDDASQIEINGDDVTGIDLQPPLGYTIRGTVTGPGAVPLAGISVSASNNGMWSETQTAADGTYTLSAVTPGDHTVSFNTSAYSGDAYASGYWSSDGYTPDEFAATPITVPPDTTGIDIQLPLGHSISGTVTGPGGAPLAGMAIHVDVCRTPDPRNEGCGLIDTSPDGSYSMAGLAPGSYTLMFDSPDGRYAGGYWSSNGLTSDVNDATPVVIVDADVHGIDVGLPWPIGPVDHLVISSGGTIVVAGGRRTFTAEGFDVHDQDLGDVTSDTTFTVDGGGSCSGASCTATSLGDHVLTGTDGTATGAATLTVTVSAPDHLVLTPASATQGAGSTQTYTAEAFDAADSSLGDISLAATFAITGTGSCTSNVCSSAAIGDHTVTVTYGSVQTTATLHVVGPWTQFRGGPDHTGYNAVETIISPANVASLGVSWTGQTGGASDSSPAVANGVVYVGGGDNIHAYAVGCATAGASCAPLWTGSTGAPISSSPAVADGVVYVGSDKLYAFDAACRSDGGSCDPIWTANTGGGGYSSPAVADGVVYIASGDGNLYAFAVGCASGGGTCAPLWTASLGGFTFSSPAVVNGVVYVGSGDSNLYAFAVGCASGGGTCTPLWTGSTDSPIWGTPAVSDGVVYVGSKSGMLYAFAVGCASGGGTCTPLWTATTGALIWSSPAIANGVVYVGSMDHKLYAFAVGCASAGDSCDPLWTATVGDGIAPSPAVANGVVYVGSNADNKVYAFGAGCRSDGGSCSPLWSILLDGGTHGAPTVVDGVVYIVTWNGTLYALGLDHGTVDHLVLSPSTATISGGASQTYTAESFDAHGNSLGDVTAATTFTIDGVACAGTSCSSALGGQRTVTGTDGPAAGTATLTYPAIAPAKPTALTAMRGNSSVGLSWTAPATGGSPITGYVVTETEGDAHGVVTCPATGTACTVGDLTNGTEYTFTVHAVNDVGPGPESDASSAVTPATIPGTPDAPTAARDNSSVTLSWSSPATGGSAITSYVVTEVGAGVVACTAVTATSCTVSGLANGIEYAFTVHAVNDVGAGTESDQSNAVTPSTTPGKPTGLTATRGDGSVGLSLSSPATGGSAITSYVVTETVGDAHGIVTCAGIDTTCTVSGLTNGTEYAFTVHAVNIVGAGPESDPSNTVTPATTPGKPTRLTATRGNGSVDLAWTAPAAGGSSITSYVVTETVGDGHGVVACSGTGASCTVSGLTNGTEYAFTVHAVNDVGAGTESDQSNAVTPAAVPGKPTALTATRGNASVGLSWTAPAAGTSPIASYVVTETLGDAHGVITCTGTGTTCTISGLTNGTEYAFTVHAVSSIGAGPESEPSNAVTPFAPNVPAKPTAVTAAAGSASATVIWTAPASNGGGTITAYTVTASGGTHTCGWTTGPLTCTVSGLTNGQLYTFTVTATNIAGEGPSSDPSNAVTPVAPGPALNTYHTVVPVRLLDTRYANGLTGKLAAATPRTFQITGRGGASNVPAGATAVTANVTIVNAGVASSVYLGPSPIAHPATSTINFNRNDITAYGSTISLGADGSMSVTYMAASGTCDLVVDITGFFTPDASGDTYHPLTPARLLDTRVANGAKKAKLKANVPITFTIRGRGGVPANAVAVTGNVTVTNASNGWAVYVGPDPLVKPAASTINFAKGQTRANSMTVALSTSGTLSATFLSSGKSTTDLVFDVTGYYTADLSGAKYVPISTPVTILDTRASVGLGGRFAANAPRTFTVRGTGGVPSTATGITGIVSVFNQTNSWAVFVGPTPVAKPATSAMNFLKGDNCANGLTVALGSDGSLSPTYLSSAGNTTNIVIVVTGYFVP